ncbi:ead/Ea22-like family protein [Pseudomonas aeruginosa]|nr:ead/Ea22-like family protein [Pseudomonas aeruginosa]MBG4286853.1 ead/Ea22-like family protein [Pseudomonas aeruginosa]
MTDQAELRRLAKAATPGEWYAVWEEGDDTAWPNLFPIIQAENGETVIGNEGFYSDLERDKANAQFCAAANPKTTIALLDKIDRLKAENEALRKDAERWRYARTILPYEVIQDAQKDLESWNVGVSEAENKRCDEAIDAAIVSVPAELIK